MPVTADDIKWAVDAFSQRVEEYTRYRNYYHGNFDLSFASSKFRNTFGPLFRELAYNRCAPVVDAMANRLKVKGFAVTGVDLANLSLANSGVQGMGEDSTSRDFAGQALTLWRLGGMDKREGELYVEAGITGVSYGVVYYDAPPPYGTGLPRIWPNRAELMRVKHDDDGRIILAAKSWLVTDGPDKGKRRLTFYTPTEIIKLITIDTAESELPKELANYTLVREVNALGQQVINPIVHDLGRVPVVEYTNNAPMTGEHGISEIRDIAPLQDALNKAIADMLVAMEYSAFHQRYATGIDMPERDPETGEYKLPWKPGPGEVWFSTDKDANFGSFDTTDLSQFLAVQESFELKIARVSFTPIHWLVSGTGQLPSGESLKTAESAFVGKLKDRQRSYGASHADAMDIFFKLLGVEEPLLIDTEWESAEPRSDREDAEIGKMMADAGVPLAIAAKRMGLDEQDLVELEALEEERATSQEAALGRLSGMAMAARLAPEDEE
jgi:hypothetical protein